MLLRLNSVLLLICLASAAQAQYIVGYYPAWAIYDRHYFVTDIPAEHLTHINYAFANIANGQIAIGDPYSELDYFYPGDCWDPGCERGNFHQLRILKQQHPHLKTLISVGGWGWSNYFSDVAFSVANRELFANSCVEFILEHGFDGVDLDWEYPDGGGEPGNIERPEDAVNFTLLCQHIRHKLDSLETVNAREYLLTLATSASPSHIANLDLVAIAAAVDFINVMCYDFAGAWADYTSFNAPLFFDPANPFTEPVYSGFNTDAAMDAYIAAGVPSSKLVVGMPFYGKGFGNVSDQSNGVYQSFSGVSPHGTWENGFYDYWDLAQNYVNQNGFTRYYHPVSHVPYLHNPTTNVFITYDDTASIREKCEYVINESLGGAMFWELAADRDGELLTTMFNIFESSTQLPPPQDLTAIRVGDSLSFRWQAVVGAMSYSLWSSNDVNANPNDYTLELTTPALNAMLLNPVDGLRVYFVRAE